MWTNFLTAIATALSLLIVDLLVPGVNIENFLAALVAAIVIGLINSGIKPIITLASLPLNYLTLGGFSLVVNGICLWLAALLVPGFQITGIIAFIAAPIVLSLVNTLMSKYFAERALLDQSRESLHTTN